MGHGHDTPEVTDDPLLQVSEAARLVGVARETITHGYHIGLLHGERTLSGTRLFRKSAVLKFMELREQRRQEAIARRRSAQANTAT